MDTIKGRITDSNYRVHRAAIEFFKNMVAKNAEVTDTFVRMLDSQSEPLARDAAYEILNALPFEPNLIHAWDHPQDQHDLTVDLWYPDPPKPVLHLLKKADQLRSATSNAPGLLPPGWPLLETARILAELGERLLTAVTIPSSTLLSRAVAKTDTDSDTLLWSWRLACICKRFF